MPFFNLKDNTHPFLVLGDATTVMPWRHSTLLHTRLRSTYLRLSPRGFLQSYAAIDALPSSAEWHRTECHPTANALCQQVDDTRQLWFPDSVVDVPDDWSRLPVSAITQLVNKTHACTSQNTGRSINMLDSRYEVSLCDVLDSNLDVIYARLPGDGTPTVIWQQGRTFFYEYLVLALVAIYLVSSVSQNIADMFTTAHEIITEYKHKNTEPDSPDPRGPDPHAPDPHEQDPGAARDTPAGAEHKTRQRASAILETNTNTYKAQNLCAFIVAVYSIVSFLVLGRDTLVSTPDVTLFAHLCIYTLLTVAFHTIDQQDGLFAPHARAPVGNSGIPGHNISLLTATLLLLTVKVHHTFDNPYVLFLSLLFGWRSFVKIFLCSRANASHVCFSLLDLVLFFSILANGVSQTTHSEVEATMLALAVIALAAISAIVTADLFDLIVLFLKS